MTQSNENILFNIGYPDKGRVRIMISIWLFQYKELFLDFYLIDNAGSRLSRFFWLETLSRLCIMIYKL